MLERIPKLNRPKLIWVTALILFILSCSSSVWAAYEVSSLQAKALQYSPEIQLLKKAIKVAESKKWTSFAPRVGIGNNFVGNGDMRFNLNFDLVEILGGGKFRQTKLDIARLELRKIELENKIKLEVLELVLALQKAERLLLSDREKLNILAKRLALIQIDYQQGKKELSSLTKYWEIEMKLRDHQASTEDNITLHKAKLKQLTGEDI